MPQRSGIALPVFRIDVVERRPVEQPGFRDGAAQRVAVSADVLGETVDDQAGIHVDGLKQPRRSHGVVDNINEPALAAERADLLHVAHLGTGIGDRLDEHHLRFRSNRVGDSGDIRRIDEGDVEPMGFEASKEAVGVAEQEPTGNQVVAAPQEREHHGTDGAHAGAETDAGDAALHAVQLALQGGYGRIDLPAVGVTRVRALEHAHQIAGVFVAVRHGGMHGLVHRAVLDGVPPVGVNDGCGEAGLPGLFHGLGGKASGQRAVGAPPMACRDR